MLGWVEHRFREDGYESVGGFSCGDDEAWSALPESPPACLPRACGPSPPSVANGLAADECGGLPSGASCEGTCRSGWSPVGAFRCELGQWVEVPICYTGAGGTATEFAVIAGLALRPSSDLAERFRTPSSWVDFGLLVPHISKAMSAMMGGSSVHVLGIATTEEGRRLQDQAWRPAGVGSGEASKMAGLRDIKLESGRRPAQHRLGAPFAAASGSVAAGGGSAPWWRPPLPRVAFSGGRPGACARVRVALASMASLEHAPAERVLAKRAWSVRGARPGAIAERAWAARAARGREAREVGGAR